MAAVESGLVTGLFLFDVADAIRLDDVRAVAGDAAHDSRITARRSAPMQVHYNPPPITFRGAALRIDEVPGFSTSFKVFEYGVISVALTRTYTGSWEEFVSWGASLMSGDHLEAGARRACKALVEKIRHAGVGLRQTFLSEDYFVFAVSQLTPPLDAHHLLKEKGADIARLLRNERKPLSADEREEVLRHRLSYLADDLAIVTWQAAFVYDTDDVQDAIEILEFANSQLLQFRYYDDLLDREMAAIYAQVEHPPRWFESLSGGRYTRAAHHLHSLFIDVNEITDRTGNALKIAADIYAARLLQLAARRLGVESWRQAVDEKLRTLDVIYRFIVEEVNMRRGHTLELTIIAILLFELALFFMGIMT